jgi:hypothetical protein
MRPTTFAIPHIAKVRPKDFSLKRFTLIKLTDHALYRINFYKCKTNSDSQTLFHSISHVGFPRFHTNAEQKMKESTYVSRPHGICP